nr:trichohyalin-like [Ciona intestinalis]|eukprot:XP_002123735.5 trichohyalin-like [Ciona intestinalis]
MQMMHPHPAYAQPDQPIQAVGVLNKPQTHMATTQKVQIKESSIGLGRRDVIEIDGKLDPRVVEHEVLNQASVVDRADALVTPSGSDNVQEMLERHAMEVAKLENELRSDEIMKINEIISDIEQKKEVEVMKLKIELKEKLKKCSTDEEKEKVMMEYATKIHKVTEGLEQEKQTRLSDLRGKLARERQRRKKELFEKHKREAELAGLDPEKVVVDIAHESEEEVNKDLLLLAQQQEKLIAELQQAYADDGVDEGGEKKAKFDAEMEARIRALNEGRGVPVVSEEGVEEIVNIGGKINSLRANMKDKMKQRRAQRKTIRGSSQLPQEFGDDEQYTAEGQVYKANLSTLQLQEDEHMENMILSALEEAELEKCESQQLEVLRMKMLEGGVDENERDQIMAEFESANQVFKDKLSMQHKKQKEELLLRLKARKTLQEELSKEKAVMKQLQGVGKHDEGRKVEIDVATVVVAQQLEQQVEALSSLDQKHAVELNKLMDNLEDENNQEETKISSHFDEQCKLQAAAAVARAEQEAREGNLNEKRTAKLVKQYQAQAEAMNNSLLTQKKRQIEEMKQKLAQRKNNRKNQLMEQQKVEKDEVLLALKEDRDASASNKIKEAEKEYLDDVAKKSGGVSSMEAFIQDTLLPRHLLEMRNLMEKIKLEVEAGRKKAEIQATSERDEAREKLTQQQTAEVSQLLIAHAGEPANKVLKLKKKLEAKHKEELKKFDKDTNDVIASAVQSALTKVQINQSESKLKLRESHLRELSEALLEFNPEEMLKKQFADESSSAAQEVLAFREMKKREIDEKIKQLKKERMKVREEASAKLLEQQTSDDLDELKAKEMMTQQEAERKEREILASNLSSDEKEKLLNEHRMNVKRIEDKLQAEKSRTQKKLQEQLEERRKRRRELQSTSGSSVEYHKEVSEDERSLDGRDGKSEDGKIGDVGDGVGKIMIIDNTKVDGGNFMLPFMIQSFTQELEVLDTKLRSSFEKNRINGATTTPFIDINDAQWMMDGSLVTLETHKLAPNQYIVYKFGLFVAKMLKPVFEMDKDVSILIATCVPENKYDRNAFRRSFFYQHSSQTLYIRVDHLSSVGDFMMVVLHCFAHITVGQMDDDADPYFLRAFYKGLKIACEDLFFTRARSGGSGDSTTLSRVEGKDLSLSILDHLVDTDVITPTSDVFSTKAFLTRMMKYGNFQSSNTLTNMIKYKPTFQQQQSVTRRMLQLANPDRAKPIILQPGLVHTSLVPSTPHTVVQQQISRLNDKLDWYNHHLVACVENQNAIAEKQNNGDKDAEFYRNEIMKIETQREVLLKEMKIMELTIHEKQRALQ